jgi:hypothetical protein
MNENFEPFIAYSALATIFLMFFLFAFIQLQPQQNFVQISKQSTVIIDYGNGQMRKFGGLTEENTSVWNLFQQAIAVGGIKVEISDHFIPRVIDGLENGVDGKHWELYVNNTKQEFSPFDIQARPGDQVIFRFE